MSDYSYENVKVDIRDGIGWASMNRPEKRNAMSPQLHYDMQDALARMEVDPDVRVVVITGDSVSMCSEACATGKPVYIFAPDGSVSYKHNRLHQELFRLGHARNLDLLDDDENTAWQPVILNEAERIAVELERRLAL